MEALTSGNCRYEADEDGYVPDVDVLSCSIAGRPWVNHEWLFQVIIYNIFNLSGADGLILMQVIIASVTMLILLSLLPEDMHKKAGCEWQPA